MRRILHIVLAMLALVGGSILTAEATIARNSATYTRCAANPCTNAHTVAGTAPLLAVCVTWWHYLATPTISAVTWNGLPLTLVATATNASCGHECKSALYVLANPPAATADTSVTFAGVFPSAIVGSISFSGVDPMVPTGTPTTATGTGTPASATVASASGEIVLDCLSSTAFGGVPSVVSGQTVNWADFDTGGFTHNASSYVGGVPSTVSAWSITGAAPWAMVAVPLKPIGGGGGGDTTPGTQRVISWTDNSDNETCFHLQWRTDQSLPNWVDLNACLPANTVSYANNIGTQTGDCYRVEATNPGGSNGFTDPVCAADAPPPPPPQPPPGGAVGSPFTFDIEEDLL